jgi:hypothetical protein
MKPPGWAMATALIAGIAVGFAIVINLTVGYWPFGVLVGAVIFLLVLAVASSVSGRWHPLWGAAGAFLLSLLLFAPVLCTSGSDGTTQTSCQAAFFGVTLPGYSGSGNDFMPNFVPALSIAVAAAAGAFLVAWRSRPDSKGSCLGRRDKVVHDKASVLLFRPS